MFTITAPQLCIKCGRLSRHLFSHRGRFVCDREECVTEAILEVSGDLSPETLALLRQRMKDEFRRVR